MSVGVPTHVNEVTPTAESSVRLSTIESPLWLLAAVRDDSGLVGPQDQKHHRHVPSPRAILVEMG